ncbi:MAG: hypothetical protein PHR45_00160 [Muribaculaceae bacterium]|nr:hypothetical protein [Muribaculaceae bacterium]
MKKWHKIILMALPVVFAIGAAIISLLIYSDNEAVPRKRGYFRIEPYDSVYVESNLLPISIEVNKNAKTYLSNDSSTNKNAMWLNIDYPRYGATVYCSYISINSSNVATHIANRIDRIIKNSRMEMPRNVVFQDTINNTSSQVFFTTAESITPLQFITTDSISFLFTGAIYFKDKVTEDSIAPVVDNITDDVMHMLQNIKKR